MTCRRERHGSTTITYFCKSGYKCDNASNKCLPGPEILKKVNKLKQEADRLAKKAAISRIAYRSGEDAKALGKLGSTYYRWNGNPKIMPTPRYRRGFGAMPRASAGSVRGPVRVPRVGARQLRLANIRPEVNAQILALVAAAAAFQSGDPNRANVAATLRKLVKDQKIPIDIDDLLGDCGTETETTKPPQFQALRWRVPDIPFEVEKRGLCKDAKDEAEREACHIHQFGQVVMDVEPQIKALCKAQENDFQERDLAALGECASRKFVNAWALRDGKMPASADGTLINLPSHCDKVDVLQAGPRGESLRDRLRRLLALMSDTIDVPGDTTSDVAPPPPSSPPAAEVTETKTEDIDEAFCAFIARRSARGELTPGGGAEIPAYCKKAMDEAKTCEQQQCSMADVIVEQEKKAAAGKAMDWGSEDRAAISRLLSEVQ